MSKYSQTKMEEIHAQIRRLMVLYPNVSGRRIASSLKLDVGFVCREKTKIERENIEALKRTSVEGELSNVQQLVDGMLPEIIQLVTDPMVSPSQRISAFKAVVMARNSTFDRKLQAAVFETVTKNGPAELTPEETALIDQALKRIKPLSNNPE